MEQQQKFYPVGIQTFSEITRPPDIEIPLQSLKS